MGVLAEVDGSKNKKAKIVFRLWDSGLIYLIA